MTACAALGSFIATQKRVAGGGSDEVNSVQYRTCHVVLIVCTLPKECAQCKCSVGKLERNNVPLAPTSEEERKRKGTAGDRCQLSEKAIAISSHARIEWLRACLRFLAPSQAERAHSMHDQRAIRAPLLHSTRYHAFVHA